MHSVISFKERGRTRPPLAQQYLTDTSHSMVMASPLETAAELEHALRNNVTLKTLGLHGAYSSRSHNKRTSTRRISTDVSQSIHNIFLLIYQYCKINQMVDLSAAENQERKQRVRGGITELDVVTHWKRAVNGSLTTKYLDRWKHNPFKLTAVAEGQESGARTSFESSDSQSMPPPSGDRRPKAISAGNGGSSSVGDTNDGSGGSDAATGLTSTSADFLNIYDFFEGDNASSSIDHSIDGRRTSQPYPSDGFVSFLDDQDDAMGPYFEELFGGKGGWRK